MAAQWNGLETIGFSEIDDYAIKILKQHWPDVPNYGDIKQHRDWPEIRCDLITGGFPCQPFSVAGERRGKKDYRWLWPEMRSVIERYRPNWVLAENVSGIIGMELDQVLFDLEILFYTTGTLVIPACALDARHRRNRVWIVANADSDIGRTRSQSKRSRFETTNSSEIVADTNNRRYQQFNPQEWSVPKPNQINNHESPATWPPEPGMGRVADGVSHRVDRLKCLGNAIVPQVATEIIRFMIQSEESYGKRTD